MDDFLNQLALKTKLKFAALVDRLRVEGPFLRRPYADKVKDKIYELRIRQSSDEIRVLYFFFLGSNIVLLHAFRKKTQKLNPKEIKKAENRMNDFSLRFEREDYNSSSLAFHLKTIFQDPILLKFNQHAISFFQRDHLSFQLI